MLYTLIHDLNDVSELTGDVLPDGLLTAEERAVYHSLKTEKRRRDWLHGRYTAKRLIQRALQEEQNRQLDNHDFAILRKESGAPAVFWLDGNGRCFPLSLSISHTGDLAFCAVLMGTKGRLGCDVEQIAPRSDHFIADYFTPEEQTFVAQTPDAQRDAVVNTIWSGKEAALKALELGLRVDTRAAACLPVFGRANSWQPLTITLDPTRLPTPIPPLSGQWRVQAGYVFTISTTSPNESLRFSTPQRFSVPHPSNPKFV